MNEHSITRQLVKSLYSTLRRFVGGLNETDLGTGTEAPMPDPRRVDGTVSPLDHGWTYQRDDVRERYESECG